MNNAYEILPDKIDSVNLADVVFWSQKLRQISNEFILFFPHFFDKIFSLQVIPFI